LPAVAILVAAGRGERLGFDEPKALVRCAGRPLMAWSLEALHAAGLEVVVALPDGVPVPAGVRGVAGGAERSHSVRNALAVISPDADVVLVHDAARPLLTPELVASCLGALGDGVDAAIAAAPLTDTIKEADGDADAPRVVRTLDRSRLWAVQTPQVFRRGVLEQALAQDDAVLAAATDDAALVEAAGGTVRLVAAPRWNLKVTVPEDLALAELLLLNAR
jgi:2-C-methyl-D-erythritol 4-phosphate cytidylyltransferase